MKKIFLILLLISVIGCSTTRPPQTIFETVEVEVVVYRTPEFEIPAMPYIPVTNLNWSNLDDHNAVGKAYVSTVKILENHVMQLHNLLEGIKKKGDTN
jgi:hypothetical protein